MADDVATADKPLTQEEVRKAMLHIAAAVHQLQASVEQVRHGEGALYQSRVQLAEALKILVKD